MGEGGDILLHIFLFSASLLGCDEAQCLVAMSEGTEVSVQAIAFRAFLQPYHISVRSAAAKTFHKIEEVPCIQT